MSENAKALENATSAQHIHTLEILVKTGIAIYENAKSKENYFI